MKNKIQLITFALLAVLTVIPMRSEAQQLNDNSIFYHSFRSPYVSHYNPTLFPKDANWYVSLPRIGLGAALPISYNDLGLRYDAQRDVTVLNLNNLIDKLQQTGFGLDIDANVDLLGVGFKIADIVNVNIASGVKIDANVDVPLGILDLITEGNTGENQHMDFGNLETAHVQAYGYLSIGGGVKIPTLPITVGARANILNGIAIASLNNLSVDLTTAEDMSYMQVASDFLVRTAGITHLKVGDSLNFDWNPQIAFPSNYGFTFDLGAKAELGIFDFSLSLLDIGPGIKWSEDPTIVVPKHQESTITFDGIDLTGVLHGGELDTAYLNSFKDSLMNMIDYTSQAEPFTRSLPTRAYFGTSATFNDMVRVGYMFYGNWSKGALKETFRCNHTLSAHLNLANWFELSLANSITYDGLNHSIFNPGIAATLALGEVVQIYAAADFVSNIYLAQMKSVHAYIGFNIVGVKKKDSNKGKNAADDLKL